MHNERQHEPAGETEAARAPGRRTVFAFGAALAGVIAVLLAGAALGDALVDRGGSDVPAAPPIAAARPVGAEAPAGDATSAPADGPDGAAADDLDQHAGTGGSGGATSGWRPVLTGAGGVVVDDDPGDAGDPGNAGDPGYAGDPDTTDGTGAPTDAVDAGPGDTDDPFVPPTVPADGDVETLAFPDPWSEPTEPLFRFVDPCAGERNGDVPQPIDCPSGVAASIVGDGADDLGIVLRITSVRLAAPGSMSGLCPDPGAPEAVLLVGLSRPASVEVRYGVGDDRGRNADGEIPALRVADIERRLANGGSDASGLACVTVDLASSAFRAEFGFDLVATSDDGASATATHTEVHFTPQVLGLLSPDEAPSRQTVVRPRNAWEADVVATHPQGESVWMAALPRNGPNATDQTCTGIEADVLAGRGGHRSAFGGPPRTGRVPADMVHPGLQWLLGGDAEAPGVPAPADVSFQTVYRFRPDNGVTYDVCTWWATPGASSVARPTVVAREVRTIAGPVRFDVTMRVIGLDLESPMGPDQLGVEVAAPWRASQTLPPTALEVGDHEFDAPIVLLDRRGAPALPTTPVAVATIRNSGRSSSGVPAVVSIPTPLPCDPAPGAICLGGFTQRYDVDLPDGAGTMTIEVTQSEQSGRAPGELNSWQIDPGSTFAEGAAADADFLLVRQAPRFAPDPAAFPAVASTFAWETNRLVTGTIEAIALSDDRSCDGAPTPVEAAAVATDVHTLSVTFDRLCAGVRYDLVGALTAGGEVVTPPRSERDYGPRGSHISRELVPPVAGYLRVDASVVSIDGADEVSVDSWQIDAVRSHRFVPGRRADGLRAPSACLAAGDLLSDGSGFLAQPGAQPGDLLGRDVTLRHGQVIDFSLRLVTLDDACGPDRPAGTRRAVELSRTFSVDELFQPGGTAVTTIDVESDGIVLQVRLTTSLR